MVNNRFLDVIKILLEHDDYITINAISKRLQVSNKTIRNDLKQVEEWLKENDLTLVKKTGVGVTILGKQDAKVHVMHLMQQLTTLRNFVRSISECVLFYVRKTVAFMSWQTSFMSVVPPFTRIY